MPSGFKFSARSLANLEGVHPDLLRLADRALDLSYIDFGISEGLRTSERQRELYRMGATWTLNSRHLTGHAIDVFPWFEGRARWDWPFFHEIHHAFERAFLVEDVPFEWGGHWHSNPDGPHFQLPWEKYPMSAKDLAWQVGAA